jgi:CheY-like chemotaxis protein
LAQAAAVGGASTATETVLLVEDCEDSRETFRFMLKALGYRVIEARDAEEATEIGRGHPDRIDILLTDVMLPGLRGGELADRLAQADPQLRIVLMSGYPAESLAVKGRPFLQKPFTLEEVAAAIEQASGREATEPPASTE